LKNKIKNQNIDVNLNYCIQDIQWAEMFSTTNANGTSGKNANDLEERDKRRLKAVWELFHSELVFLIRQLLVLR
jgi:hypothetical protein